MSQVAFESKPEYTIYGHIHLPPHHDPSLPRILHWNSGMTAGRRSGPNDPLRDPRCFLPRSGRGLLVRQWPWTMDCTPQGGRPQGWRCPEVKIMYTHTDEAPMLATYSLLPVLRAYCRFAGVKIMKKEQLRLLPGSPGADILSG